MEPNQFNLHCAGKEVRGAARTEIPSQEKGYGGGECGTLSAFDHTVPGRKFGEQRGQKFLPRKKGTGGRMRNFISIRPHCARKEVRGAARTEIPSQEKGYGGRMRNFISIRPHCAGKEVRGAARTEIPSQEKGYGGGECGT